MSLALTLTPDAASAELREDWPHRAASRFLHAGGLRWHVQIMGEGPVVLLLHGTGASTHSWRALMPLLARRFTVIAPDLPGQGFSGEAAAEALSMEGMARAVGHLLQALHAEPRLLIGHSAGAAIGARMCLDGLVAPDLLVSINGALLPLGGWAGQVFSPLARLMVKLPGMPRLFAWRAADPVVVRRLLDATGSKLDEEGIELYARLFRRPEHVAGTLGMMAAWDLHALRRDLPKLKTPLLLVIGQQDQTIRPTEARRLARILPQARIHALPGLGHLAHEEAPESVLHAILEDHP
ncbi:alpha/beta fold hydrolase [Roseococcus sp. SDR]|uniref:alpha/beta fold hydrolase BchO n=1 Tax=Roseococcus sp. SDR TaxID=2835532 RepID=UPI001BD00A12|nr:alpha/beta fold hydrolase BchO [Roseococcus sp. SDR]MBS7789918.1 alpha/beta fold hydrolase [Roseococcus sp. SDR]MBV1845232.1 alpha/beta fold hydrolase [Roseococcus sp. SDR]